MQLECSANQKTNSQANIKVSTQFIQLRTYKNEYDQTRKRFLKLQDTYIMKKSQEALLTDEIEDIEDAAGQKNNQKSKLIGNDALAYKQQQNLENAKRAAIEIEHASIGIMNGLEHNNGMLKGVDSKVNELNNNLDDSNSILARIMKKENRNKLLIVGFAIILLTAFSLILYHNL